MCGGSDVSYTYQKRAIGLNLTKVERYADGTFNKVTVKDDLLNDSCNCFGSPYIRNLNEADIDKTKVDQLQNHGPFIYAAAQRLIQERAEYMQKLAQKPTQKKGCVIS